MYSTKVLILEDHPLTRHILISALQGLGYANVFSAESGEQALALLKEQQEFDLLICDIQMPGIDGLSFLRMASKAGRIGSLIVSSAIAPDLRLAIQQLARLSGYEVLGDLGKPFSRGDLKALLLRYCPLVPRPPDIHVYETPSATEIEQGIRNGEFIPYFQPKVDLRSGVVVGAEILVRWCHPSHGLLSPGVFLEPVSRLGFLDEMTHIITRQSLHFLRRHNLHGEISLSVNLEAEQLAQPGLVDMIRNLLNEARVPATSLTLEITETGMLKAPITSIENLVRLRLLGCGVSIDDFGAGFSSLQRICEMPCSELKLDMSFIRSLSYNPRSRAAVDSLLRLSENLGLNLVAEGVETQEQLELLQELQCPIGQGYWFSPPLPAQAFATWLQARQLPALSSGRW